jgi:predicted nucleic acid-binding protein
VTNQHPPRAILDADILYSRVLYDLMGRIATSMRELDLVWSDQLIDEATRVLRTRKGLPANAAERWVSYLQTAFPDGRVDISDTLTDDTLSDLTSDPDDRHICALAVASEARYLFTADRGYLRDKLANIGVTTMHPDQFLTHLLAREPSAVLDTLEAQARAWAGGRSITELIDALERANATQFAGCARRALNA